MHAADVFASPSTREGFGITYVEAMAADCTVIAADHPDSAADKVIGDAGFLVDPTTDSIADTLDRTLRGDRPSTNPVERAQRYDWDAVTERAETACRRTRVGTGDGDAFGQRGQPRRHRSRWVNYIHTLT